MSLQRRSVSISWVLLLPLTASLVACGRPLESSVFEGIWKENTTGFFILAEGTEAKLLTFPDPRWEDPVADEQPYLRFVNATGATTANAQFGVLETSGEDTGVTYRDARVSISGTTMTISPTDGTITTWSRLRGPLEESPTEVELVEDPYYVIYGYAEVPRGICNDVSQSDQVGERMTSMTSEQARSSAVYDALRKEISAEYPNASVPIEVMEGASHFVVAAFEASAPESPNCPRRRVSAGSGRSFDIARARAFTDAVAVAGEKAAESFEVTVQAQK